ncbi:MAG: Nup93/Nic96-domain-containing protein, partial [Olpidium bornovanus]
MQQVFKIIQFVASEGVRGSEPTERAYESGYLKSPYDSRAAIELRQKFVAGARAYLEERCDLLRPVFVSADWRMKSRHYLSFMEDEIRKFPEAARLGGVPSLLAKIRAYMNVKYMKRGTWEGPNLEVCYPINCAGRAMQLAAYNRSVFDTMWAVIQYVGGQPVYAIAYYFLRTGHERKALEHLSAHESKMCEEDRIIVAAFNQYLSKEERRWVLNAKNVDPYQMALYKIIGHCDLAKKAVPGVTPTVDDWMWMQAVGFMHAQSQFQAEAVQLAVGLAYYGLLRVPETPDSNNPDIVITTGDQHGEQATHLVDFALLCQQYSWNLQASAPRFALQYLIEICLFAGGGGPVAAAYRKACHMAIVTMAVSSGDMDEILGSHQFDVRSPGMVERYLPLIHIQDMNEYRRLIVEPAADQCGKAGRWRDAVKLYHVAEDYDTVVALFNRELGAAFQRIAHSPSSTSTSVGSSAMMP